MNLFDDTDNIIINIDGKDMEMKPAICYGKVYDKWLVSKCGKVWSLRYNRILAGCKSSAFNKNGRRTIKNIVYSMYLNEEDWWGDGSTLKITNRGGIYWQRLIRGHKMVMDTWKPLYDNPPVGMSWETWELLRDRPDAFDWISKSVAIDHINDDTTDNHIDNLRRVNQWDNNPHIKKRLK